MAGDEKLERARRVAQALGALFERTRVPVIAVDGAGAFVTANDAAVRQYGYALEELCEMRIHDFLAQPRDLTVDLARAIAGDPVPLDRRPHRRKDGSVVWVAPTAGPIEVLGETLIVSVLKDVTDLVSAEERARAATENNRRDRRLVQSVVASMLSQPPGPPAPQGVAEPATRAALEALVQAFGRATGQAASAWLPENGRPRVLTRVASYREPHARAEAMSGDVVDLDQEALARHAWDATAAVLLRADQATPGSLEEAYARRVEGRGFVVPLLGRAGPYGLLYGVLGSEDDPETALSIATTLGGFGGVMLEALELEQRARRDVQAAEVTWQAAVERLDSGFALLDRERRIVRINGALSRLMKRTPEELVGRRCDEIFSHCGEQPCAHARAMAESRRIVMEIDAKIAARPLRVDIFPAYPNDAGIAAVHVATDLTEERQARSQLVTNDRLATIGRLAAGVAHEVNNPAGFVTLALQILRDQLAQGKARTTEIVPMLDEAIGAMLQINQIMRDLTGFSRERARAVIDLTSVVNSAIRIAAHETRDRAIVDRRFEEGVIANVRGARIAQVVLNLLVNAAQAIPPGQPAANRIEVRVFREGDSACVEVKDTGPGVAAGVADRIFEPFFTTREASGGTGLGLWLSRTIIEEEGGTLTFTNLPRGGASFTVRLPAYRATISEAAAAGS